MTRKDFHVGQTVYLLLIHDYEGISAEERIKEVTVLTVGKKYLTIDFWGEMKFDMTNHFLECVPGTYFPNWQLFLSREDIQSFLTRKSQEDVVRDNINAVLNKMSPDDLRTVYSIVNSYLE